MKSLSFVIAVTVFAAGSTAASAFAQSVSLIGTELSLEVHAQATPASELSIISFPATAIVSEAEVEFPNLESLFDPSVGVPPGFADALVDVAIDAGGNFLEIDFANSAPFTRFASGFQNAYVFSFESSVALQITDVSIDTAVTTLALNPDRVTFDGHRLFVNVESLTFSQSTFARINLDAAIVPEPSTLSGAVVGLLVLGIFRRARRSKMWRKPQEQ